MHDDHHTMIEILIDYVRINKCKNTVDWMVFTRTLSSQPGDALNCVRVRFNKILYIEVNMIGDSITTSIF